MSEKETIHPDFINKPTWWKNRDFDSKELFWKESNTWNPFHEDTSRMPYWESPPFVYGDLILTIIGCPFEKSELKVILCILNLFPYSPYCTYPYLSMSYVEMEEVTGLTRSTIIKAVKKLKELQVIYYETFDKRNRYIFNEYFDTWLIDRDKA